MKQFGKTFGFGLLLFIVWQLLSYISALITETQGGLPDFNFMPLVISGIVIAVLMGGLTYWFGRVLRFEAFLQQSSATDSISVCTHHHMNASL